MGRGKMSGKFLDLLDQANAKIVIDELDQISSLVNEISFISPGPGLSDETKKALRIVIDHIIVRREEYRRV